MQMWRKTNQNRILIWRATKGGIHKVCMKWRWKRSSQKCTAVVSVWSIYFLKGYMGGKGQKMFIINLKNLILFCFDFQYFTSQIFFYSSSSSFKLCNMLSVAVAMIILPSVVESIMYFLLNLSWSMHNKSDSTFKFILHAFFICDSCSCFVTNFSDCQYS